MPGGRTHFNSAWLTSTDANNQTLSSWCRAGKDSFHGYCRFCDVDILCDNSGKAQLVQHSKQLKHKTAVKHVSDAKQSQLKFRPQPEVAGTSTASNKATD
jgi:hypothetical protein